MFKYIFNCTCLDGETIDGNVMREEGAREVLGKLQKIREYWVDKGCLATGVVLIGDIIGDDDPLAAINSEFERLGRTVIEKHRKREDT